jgi:hypothetical protein
LADPEKSEGEVAEEPTPASSDAFNLVLDKATDKFAVWQQVPAWVLGASAIAGGGFLIAFPKHLTAAQTRDAWAAVIIALVLAVLLSYRSAFTLSKSTPPAGSSGAQQQKQ